MTGLDFSEAMLERARREPSDIEWIRGDLLELPFEDDSSTRRPSASGSGTSPTFRAGSPSCGACCVRAAASRSSRSRGPAARCAFYSLWFDRIVPLLGKVLPGGEAYTYLPASVRRFPGPDELAELGTGFDEVAYRLFAGGIVALHTGVG